MIRTREEFEARAASGRGFAGESLEGFALDGASFAALDFSNTAWTDVRARGAKLTACIWTGARLSRVDFEDADLSSASATRLQAGAAPGEPANRLVGVVLDDAVLIDASLAGAALAGARLGGAVLSNADLDRVSAPRATFSGGILLGASFVGADLS